MTEENKNKNEIQEEIKKIEEVEENLHEIEDENEDEDIVFNSRWEIEFYTFLPKYIWFIFGILAGFVVGTIILSLLYNYNIQLLDELIIN